MTQPLFQGSYHQTADGASLRYAVFDPPTPPRGTVLITAGRREFIEKKHTEAGVAFLARGYRVIHFEWRGQGLSDRWLTGARRQRDHAVTFATHLRDLTSLYETVIAPRLIRPFWVCGHSMGGHLLLRWLSEYPHANVKAAILTSPMQVIALPVFETGARLVAWLANKGGKSQDYALFQHDFDARDTSFPHNPLSGDPARFALMEAYFTAHPLLTVGGVTWGWASAAIASMRRTRTAKYLTRIQTPILVLLGQKDPVTQATSVIQRLTPLPLRTFWVIPNARHDLLNETDACRNEVWEKIDAFLAEHR